MKQNTKKKPELVYRGNKPVKVILDIDRYEKMLEQLEDMEDLKELQEMRKKPVKFRSLEDYLKEKEKSA